MPSVNVRLRADPTKVRVAIRRVSLPTFALLWCVMVTERDAALIPGHNSFTVLAREPMIAITRALARAHEVGLLGVDPDMQGTYPHPWAGKTV